jgi:hypothetical protein
MILSEPMVMRWQGEGHYRPIILLKKSTWKLSTKRLSLQQIIILAGLLSNKIISLDVELGNDVKQQFDYLVVLLLGQHKICSYHVNLAVSSYKIKKKKYITAGGDIAVSSRQGLLEIITHGGDTNCVYHDIVNRLNYSRV